MLPFVLALLAAWPLVAGEPDKGWPPVTPVTVEVLFDGSAERFDVRVPISASSGPTLYRLRCLGGSDDFLDTLSNETGETFVGPLSCWVVPGNRERGSNLLAEDESPTWHTRAQFHRSELVGACGEYPEYGRVRHFRLRGFTLTLRVDDLEAEEGEPLSFRFGIWVEPDASITSPFAEQPGYLRPKSGHCEPVLKGHDIRMCRDPEASSWQPCEEQAGSGG